MARLLQRENGRDGSANQFGGARQCNAGRSGWDGGILSLLGIAGLSLLLAGAAPPYSSRPVAGTGVQNAPAAPGRIIVRYAPVVSVSAARVIATHGRFEAMTGSPSLDHLNEAFGVRAARPLFFDRAKLDGKRATTAYYSRYEAARARFATRAARAPAGAVAPDLSNVYLLEIDENLDVFAVAAAYAADPSVVYAHPDYIVSATFVPNDPFFSSSGTWGQPYQDLWGLHVTDAQGAWDVSNGAGTVVAVVDTGIDRAHPDIAANIWTNPGEIAGNGVDDDLNGFVDDVFGWDFVNGDNNPNDRNGHGTHVAGTVAAAGENGIGVVGMAWGGQVMAVRGLDAQGSGFVSDLSQAVVYAAESGADVISNSWGGGGISQVLEDAIATARSLGAVVVAAAGNNAGSADSFEPAGIDGVITVGASQNDGTIASFSNSGSSLNVAAPGVDILSLRAANSANVGGNPVAADYLRLSGTSMAAPHASGLVAVLLANKPSLTVDEVQWHLELNADQPGFPGFEGELWNPFFGWGRINAANVFNTPPVTTRLTGSSPTLHLFVGEQSALQGSASLRFTTLNPVSWTAQTSPWVTPSPVSGNGPADITLSYDTAALSPGGHMAQITINAPAAADGGGGFSSPLFMHRDEGIGAEMVFSAAVPPGSTVRSLTATSNQTGTMLVWASDSASPAIRGIHIDNAGHVTGPFTLFQSSLLKDYLSLATDGHDYLLAWAERDDFLDVNQTRDQDFDRVLALRIGPTGTPIDSVPIEVARFRDRDLTTLQPIGVAFAGGAYTIAFSRWLLAASPDREVIYVRRLLPGGSFSGKARLIRNGVLIAPQFSCTETSCLFAWSGFAGVRPSGFFNWALFTLQLVGDELVQTTPTLQVAPVLDVQSLVARGGSYVVGGDRLKFCGQGEQELLCRWDALAIRLAEDGTPIDPAPIELNFNSPVELNTGRRGAGVACDDNGCAATFVAHDFTETSAISSVFVSRLSPDGTLMDSEDEGLLAFSSAPLGANAPVIARDALQTVVAWADRATFDPHSDMVLKVVRMFSTGVPSQYLPAAIGSIGTLQIDEGQVLKVALQAPGLDPATTTFSASGLPQGSALESPTGLFTWRPSSTQSGVYGGVRFEASDSVGTVSEDVTIEVAEAVLALSGTVTDAATGDPVPGVALKLRGLRRQRPMAFTDGLGRFRFEGLTPGRRYRIKLDKPSKKQFRSEPRSLVVDLGAADFPSADMVLQPR